MTRFITFLLLLSASAAQADDLTNSTALVGIPASELYKFKMDDRPSLASRPQPAWTQASVDELLRKLIRERNELRKELESQKPAPAPTEVKRLELMEDHLWALYHIATEKQCLDPE